MKNYEKYADEIREYDGEAFCNDFVQPYILKQSDCSGMDCDQCSMLKLIWLLEEYEEPQEPKVDWNKVKVDTPILVRDYEDTESATVVWLKRYFAEYKDGLVYAWTNGRTSWNEDKMHGWKYAKLAEDEDSK